MTFLTQDGPREKKKTETCRNLISDIWRLLLLLFSQFTDNFNSLHIKAESYKIFSEIYCPIMPAPLELFFVDGCRSVV